MVKARIEDRADGDPANVPKPKKHKWNAVGNVDSFFFFASVNDCFVCVRVNIFF